MILRFIINRLVVILLINLLLLTCSHVRAQELVNVRFYNITLSQAINFVAKKHIVHIAYNPSLTDKLQVNLTITDKSIDETLRLLTRKTSLTVQKVDSRSYIIKEKAPSVKENQEVKKKRYTLSGYVAQEGSDEKLIAASISIEGKTVGTISNEYGFYSLTAEEGTYTIVYSYVGYQPIYKTIELTQNRQFDISMIQSKQLQEVVITQIKANELHTRPQMSLNSISMDQVKNSPVLLGEADLLKTIQLLPGVKSGSEGSSGVYVRGGSPDQNLILLDGVPIYNVSHMMGLFSVFNADAINNTQIFKGGFPARYGERLSSVIDVRMKEGNMQKYEGELALGLISSKFSLSGPIIKDKTAFIISARRTYADLLIKGVELWNKSKENETNDAIPNIYFYDINIKVNHKLSNIDRLYLSFYGGRDVINSSFKDSYTEGESFTTNTSDVNINWGNTIGAIRWNHIFTPKLFANATATYTRYNFRVNANLENITTKSSLDESQTSSSKFLSGIDDISGKIDFDYIPSTSHSFKFGISTTHHLFTPSASEQRQNSTGESPAATDDKINNKINANKLAAYIEDTYSLNRFTKINVGLRSSLYQVSSTSYYSVEPRLSVSLMTSEKSSIKLSYVEMSQYLHFLTMGSLALPSDLWVPTTSKVKPQKSKQVALGYTQSVGQFDLSVESYYKRMNRIIEYKDGAAFSTFDTSWEDKVTAGKGTSYGVEFMAEKKEGKLRGWIAYTLSWADRKFDNLNFGRSFPFSYDKRHDISVTLNYKFSSRVDMGMNWVFNTGRAFTLGIESYKPYTDDINPQSPIVDNGNGNGKVTNNSDRNNIRFPSYHRLDLGINFHKKKKWGERTWSLGVYNAYCQKNTFYMYPNTERGTFKSVSLLSLIPSVTYTFKF